MIRLKFDAKSNEESQSSALASPPASPLGTVALFVKPFSLRSISIASSESYLVRSIRSASCANREGRAP